MKAMFFEILQTKLLSLSIMLNVKTAESIRFHNKEHQNACNGFVPIKLAFLYVTLNNNLLAETKKFSKKKKLIDASAKLLFVFCYLLFD